MDDRSVATDGKVLCLWIECGKRFRPKKPWQKFHSSKCRDSHHTAERKKAVELLRAQQAS